MLKYRFSLYVLLSLIFFSLAVPLILKPTIDIFDEADEACCHYPATIDFKNQFPNLDLIHYNSATTPLYHITLAILSFVFGSDIIHLRFISFFISLACLMVIHGYLSKRGKMLRALFFTVIIMLSPYFIGPAVRLSTDNMALLFAILSIFTMDTNVYSTQKNIVTNILILITILTRQVYAWLAGAYLIATWWKHGSKKLISNWMQIILPVLIPIIGLAYFIFLWKGLTPPTYWARDATKSNWDAPVYIVSLVGLFGSFFIFWLWAIYKETQPKFLHICLLVIFGITALLLRPVSNEYPVLDRYLGDRGGSLWLVVSHLPNLLSSSIVFWILFPVGLVFLFVMARHLISKQNFLIIICFSLWLMANIINANTYQKYYEPFILFSIGYTLIPVDTEEKWHYWIGPVVLLTGFIGVALVRFF